jgi:hypothetical protein
VSDEVGLKPPHKTLLRVRKLTVPQMMDNARPFLMGKVAAVVDERKSAREIVDELVSGAVYAINKGSAQIVSKPRM